MAGLSVADVFAPDDRAALFCVSMAMAANDVEYAIRQAIVANPDVASDEERERLRFSQKVRLTYGFLSEGIDALKAWRQQEPAVAKLLRELPKDGAKLLTKVCGLEQQIGTETIAHVRHNTFQLPAPRAEQGGESGSPSQGARRSLASLDDQPATVAMSEEAQHTFPFADQVALRMALLPTTRMPRPWSGTARSHSSTWSDTFTSASASSAASASSLSARGRTTSRSRPTGERPRCLKRCPAWLSEKLQELGAIQAGGADDLVERSLRQIATVHRDDDPVGVIGMPEDVVAPLDPIELPATALQPADRLARRDGR